MRRGVVVLVLVALTAAFSAAAARADGGTTTTTATTTAATTTVATTTSTTTSTTTTTATTPAPSYAPLSRSLLPTRCVGGGAVAIREPGRRILALGTPARRLGLSEYPEKKPLVTFDASTRRGSRCGLERVTLRNVSLLRGAVTAEYVTGLGGTGRVLGLEVRGKRVALRPGESVAVGNWALLVRRATVGRLSAPLVLRLLKRHDSLPKGTRIFVAFAAESLTAAAKAAEKTTPTTKQSAPARKHRRHKEKHGVPQPLTVTPKLGIWSRRYVFPVAGGASYIDTYGGNRSDIYDGWHHGDDLFAALGTPVVAVTKGKLSLVGWNHLGGWRLWLTDQKGNAFYYAHLAGYARWILHHRNVKAGQVVGFVGRTGDAFTTSPHLHFEIHPHQLLRLGYDGAVDPTSYLGKWKTVHVPQDEIPQAARLRAPVGTPSQEAAVVWRELLAARHLGPDGKPIVAFPFAVRRPFPPGPSTELGPPPRRLSAVRTAEHIAAHASYGPWPLVVLSLAIVASMLGAYAAGHRRRAAS